MDLITNKNLITGKVFTPGEQFLGFVEGIILEDSRPENQIKMDLVASKIGNNVYIRKK